MTPEQVELLKKLQPKIKECMGELTAGDYYICPECGLTLFLGDRDIDACVYADSSKHKILRIPLAIDPINPERGLSEMINGSFTLLYLESYKHWLVTRITCRDVIAADPYTALLKALCEQENIK